MIRAVLFLTFLTAPAELGATSYHHCVSPLVVPDDPEALPQNGHTFRLTLGDNQLPLSFVAQGFAFDGDETERLTWHGSWINHGGQLQLIGPFTIGTDVQEWRARAEFTADDVMILSVDQSAGAGLILRCLPAEGG